MRRLAICLGLLSWPALAMAQGAPIPYPQKVVSLVTHSSPGGGSDVFLREMVKRLSRHLDATFIVENVQGGSGARAMTKVATAKPDGSIFYAITPTYVFTSLLSKPPHTYKDLLPVAIVFTDAEVLYTRADGPFQSVKDVIDRARTARGRWGVANPASLERQAAERLKAAAGVNAAIVSHEGGGDMMINVLNGTLDAGVGEVPELRAQLDRRQGAIARHVQCDPSAGVPRPADHQGGRFRRDRVEVSRARRAEGVAGRRACRLAQGAREPRRRPGVQEVVRGGEPRRRSERI